MKHKTYFALPIRGTTGYSSIDLEVYESTDTHSTAIAQLQPGQGFLILAEEGDWWQISLPGQDNLEGYVLHEHAMVNLPDLIPSLIFYNSNGSASLFRAMGKAIPGITGRELYQSSSFNPRLSCISYRMPLLYNTAQKLAHAQALALEEGNSIIVYEAFRPYDTQQSIVQALTDFSQTDPEVLEGISAKPWEMDWFICTGVSNHQIGYAVDLGLAKVDEMETVQVGVYHYQKTKAYTPYEMPSPIHELSTGSASLAWPVPSRNDVDWRTTPVAPAMNQWGLKLRAYCTQAGLTPLASEWWHFNNVAHTPHPESQGNYLIQELYSQIPENNGGGLTCE